MSHKPVQFEGISFDGKTFPKVDEKILIVGAGPSGLHMGHLLKKKGYKNIKFYEATDRVAGKSVSIPHRVQKDVVHELGTCYLHPAYYEVRELLKELEDLALNGVNHETEPKGYRVYAKNQPNLGHYMDNKDYIEFNPWIFASIEHATLPKFFWSLPSELSVTSLALAVVEYGVIYRKILGHFKYNLLPNILDQPEKYKKINMPFQKFLEEHHLQALIPLLGYGMTAQGYGILQTVPTYYAMMWITPELLYAYITPELLTKPKKAMLTHGFQNVWETMNKVNQFDITFNCNIESIVRNEFGVEVKGTHGPNNEPLPEIQFDYLFVACPPKKGILNMDWRDEETQIFDKLNSCIFKTTLYERGPDPNLIEHLAIWPEFLIGDNSGKGEVYAFRDSVIALKHDNRNDHNDVREQMCYQFWDDRNTFDEKVGRQQVEKFANDRNIPDFKILLEKKFDYFYHFDQKELDQGYPYKVLDLQGQNKTIFVHASVHFESILDIVKYNTMLFDALHNL